MVSCISSFCHVSTEKSLKRLILTEHQNGRHKQICILCISVVHGMTTILKYYIVSYRIVSYRQGTVGAGSCLYVHTYLRNICKKTAVYGHC